MAASNNNKKYYNNWKNNWHLPHLWIANNAHLYSPCIIINSLLLEFHLCLTLGAGWHHLIIYCRAVFGQRLCLDMPTLTVRVLTHTYVSEALPESLTQFLSLFQNLPVSLKSLDFFLGYEIFVVPRGTWCLKNVLYPSIQINKFKNECFHN